MITGENPREFDCTVVELIRRLKKEGRQSGDIAVLGYKKEHLDQIGNSSQDEIFFTDSLSQWSDRGSILKTTVQSFKGLEANVIIVADDDVPMLGHEEQNHLRYVCESRAKYRLYLHRAKK